MQKPPAAKWRLHVITMILYAPRSSGPQAYADGYSAVSAVLPEYYFAPIFREFARICREMPLQKNVANCRKSVGKIYARLPAVVSTLTSFFFLAYNNNHPLFRKIVFVHLGMTPRYRYLLISFIAAS